MFALLAGCVAAPNALQYVGDTSLGDDEPASRGIGPPEDDEVAADASSRTTWVKVSDYRQYACGLLATGEIRCWGNNPYYGEDGPPSGTFTDLAMGYGFGCAIDTGGAVTCWGLVGADKYTDVGQVDPPTAGVYHGIAAGDFQVCALDDTDAIVCWGYTDGSWAPPSGTYSQISMESFGACAVASDGSGRCWGSSAGTMIWSDLVAVAVGFEHTCGLDSTGAIMCGGGVYGDTSTVPEGYTFVGVDAGVEATCGIEIHGRLVCWAGGKGLGPESVAIAGVPPRGSWAQVEVGDGTSCGLTTSGHVACWGSNTTGLRNVPWPI